MTAHPTPYRDRAEAAIAAAADHIDPEMDAATLAAIRHLADGLDDFAAQGVDLLRMPQALDEMLAALDPDSGRK